MSKRLTTAQYWWLWIVASLALTGLLAHQFFWQAGKSLFMPGDLTDGHHQFADNCETCHTKPFADGKLLQEACIQCHGDLRKKPFDSHPLSKFKDPRNADRLETINALACVTCHTEHKPEITLANGLTQPRDVCYHCHADIGEDRPSHQGMAFTTCKDSGCHNYHNNRALYTDFLLKHADEPNTKNKAEVPAKEFATVLDQILEYPRDRYPLEPLNGGQIDAPDKVSFTAQVERDWLTTAHAQKGVNCSACHQPVDAQGQQSAWTDHPGVDGCVDCHNLEVESYTQGKHGMRLAAELPPMNTADARLPMQPDARHKTLTCTSCHAAHRFDVHYAAAEACLQCHADDHSLAYENTPHERLWQAEIAGKTPPNTGVSCATCHMPRVEVDVNDWMSRTLVTHNQNLTLSPNSKMLRPACLHCHGLGFSIDALADESLIDHNFQTQPNVHVNSIEMAEEDHARYLREKEAAKSQ